MWGAGRSELIIKVECGALYYPFTHLQPFSSKRLNLGPQKIPRRKDLYLKPGASPPLLCEPVSLLQTAPKTVWALVWSYMNI